MKALLLGKISPSELPPGIRYTSDPAEKTDIVIASSSAAKFIPEAEKVYILLEGTMADFAARQLCPGAVFVKSLNEIDIGVVEESSQEEKQEIKSSVLLAVYSNKGGVGKSTTAISIAVTLAQNGVKTLLADFDFGAPDVATYFGLKHAKGIDEIANGSPLASVVREVRDNLYILPGPAGIDVRDYPSSMLKGILEDAKRRFEAVVVDTPPAPFEKENLHIVYEMADLIYAIVDQSSFSVKETSLDAPKLLAMGAMPERIRIILNRYSPKLTSVHQVEQAFSAGFKKEVKVRPQVKALIPEGWEEHIKAQNKGAVINEDIWNSLSFEVMKLLGKEITESKQGRKKWFTWKK